MLRYFFSETFFIVQEFNLRNEQFPEMLDLLIMICAPVFIMLLSFFVTSLRVVVERHSNKRLFWSFAGLYAVRSFNLFPKND